MILLESLNQNMKCHDTVVRNLILRLYLMDMTRPPCLLAKDLNNDPLTISHHHTCNTSMKVPLIQITPGQNIYTRYLK